jgi:hypothetical protein
MDGRAKLFSILIATVICMYWTELPVKLSQLHRMSMSMRSAELTLFGLRKLLATMLGGFLMIAVRLAAPVMIVLAFGQAFFTAIKMKSAHITTLYYDTTVSTHIIACLPQAIAMTSQSIVEDGRFGSHFAPARK